MLGKLLTGLCLAMLCSLSFAETCPNVNDIKTNHLNGWKAYDSDDGAPLSTAREVQFKKMVEQFALAEWANGKRQSGAIHCYYRDSSGSNLEAYLAKDHFVPKQTSSSFWYSVSGYMHCAARKENCEFETKMLGNHQLAKK
ncbi:hypothetical protein AQUSIP_21490 [Aquicella siphonis]|uniref:Uncharacterized protein n=1 Tax=Aquicella siphonis TaxID=254247 RepID=A0A5E4PKP6_9COXI|nr:DUF3757 domain-containing protein [Aquicella siphonis]VVC76822.1 hypothetical protein AQUSIP_21490 [Aquicella siphonis]